MLILIMRPAPGPMRPERRVIGKNRDRLSIIDQMPGDNFRHIFLFLQNLAPNIAQNIAMPLRHRVHFFVA